MCLSGVTYGLHSQKLLGLELGSDTSRELKVFMPAHADIWDRIVAKYNLQKISMKDLLGESHHFADLMFGYGMDQPGYPNFITNYELRKAGFNEFVILKLHLCGALQRLHRSAALTSREKNRLISC